MLTWIVNHSPLFYLTQSLWRDEVFSVLVAEKPIVEILSKLNFEPPLYYLLLHTWINLFGNSEVATRSLSFVAFALATVIVVYWAEKLYPKHWLSWFLPIFFFCNPMLIYYAFEVRTYGWYIFFATVSMYTYLTKKWGWFTISTVLAFYTHTYAVFVPLTQAIHYFLTHKVLVQHPSRLLRQPAIRSFLAIAVFIAPWLVRVAKESSQLKQSWYFPVDWHLIASVLGNMFIGYEGTPWYGWGYTMLLSVVLLILFGIALIPKAKREAMLFFTLMVFVPLVVVIGISFIKPLFVNRYVIPVTIAEVMIVAGAIAAIRQPIIQRVIAGFVLLFVLLVNTWYPLAHPKLDMRSVVRQVNALARSEDLILSDSPLVFFETIYYSRNRSRVFLYNPTHHPFPWYVGSSVVTASQMVDQLPFYPTRAFLLHGDGSYELVYRTVKIL